MSTVTDLALYFPSINLDASRISWAHAINSKSQLASTLSNSKIMMIEADVLQKGGGTPSQELVAVMAHPPATNSDLTYSDFLYTVDNHLKQSPSLISKATGLALLGVKLDFKTTAIVEICLQQLKSHPTLARGPLVINADILTGPNVDATVSIVDPVRFLRLFLEFTPTAVLSVGWSTAHGLDGYSWKNVFEMYRVLSLHLSSKSVAITFPVRASLLSARNHVTLRWLMHLTGGSLTVWSAKTDAINLEVLMSYRASFNKRSIMFDIPSLSTEQWEKLLAVQPAEDPKRVYDQESTGELFRSFGSKYNQSYRFQPDQWTLIPHVGSIHAHSADSVVVTGSHIALVSHMEVKPTVDICGDVYFTGSNSKDVNMSIVVNSHGISEDLKIVNGYQASIRSSGVLSIAQFVNGDTTNIQTHRFALSSIGISSCYVFHLQHSISRLQFTVDLFNNCDTANPTLVDKAVIVLRTSSSVITYRPTVTMSAPDALVAMSFLSVHV